MSQSNETRRAGGAAGFGKMSFCRCDNSENNCQQPHLSSAAHAQSRARLRRQRHVECLHRLGLAPLFHLLTDLDAGKPLWPTVEEYAALPADFIKVLGGDQFAPLVHVIDEGGHG
jgi:hypothetical protein